MNTAETIEEQRARRDELRKWVHDHFATHRDAANALKMSEGHLCNMLRDKAPVQDSLLHHIRTPIGRAKVVDWFDVHSAIRDYVETNFPSITHAAAHFNTSEGTIRGILDGSRSPGVEILARLGFRRCQPSDKVQPYLRTYYYEAPHEEEEEADLGGLQTAPVDGECGGDPVRPCVHEAADNGWQAGSAVEREDRWVERVEERGVPHDVLHAFGGEDKDRPGIAQAPVKAENDIESAYFPLRFNKWDLRFLAIAAHYASFSKDPSTQVGAIIANGKEQISQGYNGFPAGVDDNDELLNTRDQKLPRTVHAEANAIIRAGNRSVGATMYIWPAPPCASCASLIIQAGIKRVVYLMPDLAFFQRWATSFAITADMFHQAGVEMYGVPLGRMVGQYGIEVPHD